MSGRTQRGLVVASLLVLGLAGAAGADKAQDDARKKLETRRKEIDRALGAMPGQIRQGQLDPAIKLAKDWTFDCAALTQEGRKAKLPEAEIGWTQTYAKSAFSLHDSLVELKKGKEELDRLGTRLRSLESTSAARLKEVETKARQLKDFDFITQTWDKLQAALKKRQEEDRAIGKSGRDRLAAAQAFRGAGLFAPVANAIDDSAARWNGAAVAELKRGYDLPAVQAFLDGREAEAYKRLVREIFFADPKQVIADIKDEGLPNLQTVATEPGWIDVHAHGSPSAMLVRGASGVVKADHRTVFNVIRAQVGPEDLAHWQTKHEKLGLGVRLLSCSTGGPARANLNIAQNLANKLGVPVKAPTQTLWSPRVNGKRVLKIHECAQCKGSDKPPAGHIQAAAETGKWQVFKPLTREAADKLRADLEEEARVRKSWAVILVRVKKETLEGKTLADATAALKAVNGALTSKAILENLKAGAAGEIKWAIKSGLDFKEGAQIHQALKPKGLSTLLSSPYFKDLQNPSKP